MNSKGYFNGAHLKWIAIITMIIDHFGMVILETMLLQQNLTANSGFQYPLVSAYWICRLVGRLAFPLFAFLVAEGFLHTKSVKNYGLRLGLFALLSEVPFDLANFNTPLEFSYQNIFFELSLGVLVLWFLKRYENIFLQGIVLGLGCGIATLCQFDYQWMGILVISAFYLLRNRKPMLFASEFVLNILQMTAVVSLIFIALYNGERGRQMKYLFYGVYPVHLLLFFFWKSQLLM